MKKILLISGVIIFSISFYFINLSKGKIDLAQPQLVILCKGNVQTGLEKPDSHVAMKGTVSLTTLGNHRVAIGFSGQLYIREDRFTLSRTLMMDSTYHAENQILELNYRNMFASNIDTAPDDVFFKTVIRSNTLILKLSQFSDNALLVSNGVTPLYVCIAQ